MFYVVILCNLLGGILFSYFFPVVCVAVVYALLTCCCWCFTGVVIRIKSMFSVVVLFVMLGVVKYVIPSFGMVV